MLWVIAAAMVLAAGMGNAQGQSAGAPAPRYALVIGNAAYTTPGWQLKNPVNDARLMATRLRSLGFQVTPVENATKAQMEAAMNGFTARLRAGGPNAVGVFYYAGHGVEHDGANLLVPVDVTARSMDELRYQAPPMQFLLRDVARVGNAVNIIILDACRNLPLPSGSRSGPAGGLAELADVPTNVLIAYATRPGLTAPDNPGESNSVFTRILAYALEANPNDTAVNLFSEVQAKVYQATDFKQRPEFRSGLLRAPTWRFARATPVVAPSPAPQPAFDPRQAELAYWNSCCGSGATAADFEGYLAKVSSREFPGTYADMARRRAQALRAPPPASSPATMVRPSTPNAGGTPAVQGARLPFEPEMVRIPSGTFVMGSPPGEIGRRGDEGPQRRVSVRAFEAGRYEVTFAEWDACTADGGCGGYRPFDEGWGRDRRPVIKVSWDDAKAYAQWLSRRTGKSYRLLTEAEWEYAARAGTTGRFSNNGGEAELCGIANHADQSTSVGWRNSACSDGVGERTAPVGRFAANAFGLHDMHGNVWEWVEDCYTWDTSRVDADNTATCTSRIFRGGSWVENSSRLRSATRDGGSPVHTRSYTVGFRVARTL
jgi:formylglycine-generating enzyme required for sulfatase activity